MTHNPSRKHFFAKLLGVVGAASVLPKVFAKPDSSGGGTPAGLPRGASSVPRFEVRHDTRAVARRDIA